RTLYPDDAWTRRADGSPIRPYDTATDTFAEFMGVRVDPLQAPLPGGLEIVAGALPLPRCPALPIAHTAAATGYLLDTRLNDTFGVVNSLLQRGIPVGRLDEAVRSGDLTLPPGAFHVPADASAALQEAAG